MPGNPGRVVLYMKAGVEKGKPGIDASTPGTPALKEVTVVPSRVGPGSGMTYGPVIYLPVIVSRSGKKVLSRAE